VTILKVRGIPVVAHWSWIAIFALVSWSLATSVFPSVFPRLSPRSYLIMGAVSAVFFFASILLHELGHAFRALREGLKIRDITLWLFGGVARIEGGFPGPGPEFRIAVAGPVVSLALALLFEIGSRLTARIVPIQVHGVFDYLARINLVLLVFNMVPALPLDGGRVLQAALWKRWGSFTSATIAAARGGRIFAYLLMLGGFGVLTTGETSGGLWLMIIGTFILQATRAEVAQALVVGALHGVKVSDLMSRNPLSIPPTSSVADLLALAGERRAQALPVVENDGRFVGLVTHAAAMAVPEAKRSTTQVSQVMAPAAVVPVTTPESPAMDVTASLGASPAVVVLANDRVVGKIGPAEVEGAVASKRERLSQAGSGHGTTVVAAAAIFSLLVVGSIVYRPPLYVLAPGLAVDVSRDVTIKGVPVTKPHGRYLLVAVLLQRPSALGAVLAVLNSSQSVVPLDRVLTEGVSEKQYADAQRQVFKESQVTAAAAAAKQLGLDVQVNGDGSQIVSIMKGSPADGRLEIGDVIIEANGSPVKVANDLRSMTTTQSAGTVFHLKVLRKAKPVDVTVTSRALPGLDQPRNGLGIFATTKNLDVKLPFEVTFKDRRIGGPSAGLAYALAITDLLDPKDLARGRTIAVSGTISLDGQVGEVGGLEQKAQTARKAGARLFLVPSPELAEAGHLNRVQGVDTLKQAVTALEAS
jgi:PDZ domain-containing secreted protein/Zn-dependent protease/predicted transcriptional regulator